MNKPGRPTGAHTQAVRVVRIVRHLYNGEIIELSELAEYLNVSPRTLRRDISAIRSGGLQVEVKKSKVWLAKNKSLSEQLRDKKPLPEALKQAKENWI